MELWDQKALFDKLIDDNYPAGSLLDYEKIISTLQPELINEYPALYKDLINGFKAEQKIWTDWMMRETNPVVENIEKLEKATKELESLLLLIMNTNTPFDEKSLEAAGMLKDLKKQLEVLNNFSQLSPNDKLSHYLSYPDDFNILHSNTDIDRVLANLRTTAASLPAPQDPSTIPLENDDSVRNQAKRGKGIRIGTSHYLTAFYKFSQTCNKLISMNSAWGMELAELQKLGSDLSIASQNAMNELMSQEMNKFNKDSSGSKISIIQSKMGALQAAYSGYQKQLETVMPLILEQPKNITKDLDKFLEAAKSVLQLLTTYANFRL
ncbi:MAG: hypothetical protein LVR00_05355 [Rhabdochlamydiaceae bacterium]